MPSVQHIASRIEIPTGQKYVLVTYGEKSEQTTDSLGVTITVPHGTSMAMSV